jgi:hypothetical protein
MSSENDNEAYILARKYNFLPKTKAAGSPGSPTDNGKYEPVAAESGGVKSMILASFTGRSNLLIQYRPDEL